MATGRPAAWVAAIHSLTFMCAAAAAKEGLRGEPIESLERRPLRSSGVMHARIFWRVGGLADADAVGGADEDVAGELVGGPHVVGQNRLGSGAKVG